MYRIVTVENQAQAELFIALPKVIYQNDPNWVQPLDLDIEAVFDQQKNKFFRNGACERILLYQEDRLIGRCAVFHTTKYKAEQPTGGIGFFECINSQEAANTIFDYCKQWLSDKGYEAMDGPINFGERDKWWGLVIEGYQPALYCMNYNLPYYKTLFEQYGFQIYYNQECYGMQIADEFSDKIRNNHAKYKNDPTFSVKHFEPKLLEQFAADFTTVYNKAWKSHGGGKTLNINQTKQMFKTMKPIMDKQICFLLYHNDTPIGGWLNLPDLNFYFKQYKGKLGLWQKIQLIINQRLKRNPNMVGLVFGVIPEWQGKGVDAYLIVEGYNRMSKHTNYQYFEMQWIGDFNPKMINVAKGLGAHITRKLATYRYLFDINKPFSRHPYI